MSRSSSQAAASQAAAPAGRAPRSGRGRASRPRRGRASRRIPRRLSQLVAGLLLYGASSALLVRSGLGLEPWNVLHQGLSKLTGLSIGTVVTIMGGVVLLLWIPLRQKPGLGTVANVLLIGAAMDATLAVVPDAGNPAARVALMIAGVVLNGLATGLYIAARFGPGPRDGLMTGLHRVTGRSIRLIRTLLELVVVATGFLLGGSLGIGTIVYALAIGPLAQLALRLCAIPGEPPADAAPAPDASSAPEPTPTPGPAPAPAAGGALPDAVPGGTPAT